jgi:flagellar motility protein MotE (MotC chaperone)
VAEAQAEKSTYSGFERFLFFLTPILFTAVMLGMLLLLFNEDWRNKALEIGNRVPVLKAVLPDPKAPAAGTMNDEEITVANAARKVEELRQLLAQTEASLKEATDLTLKQRAEIEMLKAQVDELSKEREEAAISAEEYSGRIKSLANIYARMPPNRAAPILESMSLEESALILGAMDETQRSRVLEKMTPQKAADVSMKLKDSVSVRDQQIAALQARIRELETNLSGGSPQLDLSELKNTFSAMDANAAASLLIEMAGSDPSKALAILGAMDDNVRSRVLAAMSADNTKLAASLVGKLLPANP